MSTNRFAACGALAVLLICGSTWAADGQDVLAGAFAAPPRESQPWCYWWWLNGAASKEGITRDFEEMKKQGVGGALLFDAGEAGPDVPRGPAFMSPEWRELFKHAVREADRCGVALTVNLCSGWDAGGPWVTPEHAAKKLVGTATTAKGPGHINIVLPQPEKANEFYRDIAVLAWPLPAGEANEPKISASSSYRDYLPALARDGSNDTRWISNGDQPGMGPTQAKPEFLQFDYDEEFPAAGLYLNPYSDCGPKDIEIQCSDDGKTYRTLKRTTIEPHQELTLPLDEVRSKHFRVAFLSSHPFQGKENWNVQVAEIALMTGAERDRPVRGPRGVCQRSQMLDLTKFFDAQGRLDWDAPVGIYSVLRIGYTLHGNMIKCVGSGPTGLEIDTMSAEAMDSHFAETGAKLIADAGALAGKTLQYFHIDSWELGQPTWTPKMREEFQKRRGYDPLFYLPALLQRTVDDPQTTRKFLGDFRRTAADLVAANYYGRLRELSVKGGLRGTHPESGGPFFDHWIDALQCEGVNDVPMGEFWKRNAEPAGPISAPPQSNPSVKQAASAAHIYGKPVCQAEAFTSFGCDWIDDPWSMKDIGDEAFCHGLTRNVLCFWVHQPRLDAKPGCQWAHVGTHFDPNITWWNMSGAWLTYLARCQHMLRQGLFVADFAYLQSEDIPAFISPRDKQQPMRPDGFDYDVLNSEVLLTRAAVRDGRLTLPDGMSYRYLVLTAELKSFSSPVQRKIEELVKGGLTVLDARDRSLVETVKADRLPPDIEYRSPSQGSRFDWIHRRSGDSDIYFVANLASVPATATVVFRTAGKQPELWDAVTGQTRDMGEWQVEKGCTAVPLVFAPRQSWFVVFRKSATASGPSGQANFCKMQPIADIANPWQVCFDSKLGGPGRITFERLDDWTKRPEDGIKFYSGSATYKTTFALPQSKIRKSTSKVFLDLGTVKNVARVKLNGRDLGVVWTAPWQVEITADVRPEANEVEIEVANLWPNRLIGDAGLPGEKRLTATNVRTYDTLTHELYGCPTCTARKKSGQPANLLPSGLLGPVRVMQGE